MYQPKLRMRFLSRIRRIISSVRFRLSLWYVGILALVLVIFGTIIYSVESNSLSGAIDSELRFVGEQLPQTIVADQGKFTLPEQLATILQGLANTKLSEQVLNQLQTIPAFRLVLEGRYMLILVDGQGKVTQSFGQVSPNDLNRLTSSITSSSKTEGSFQVFTTSEQPPLDYRIYVNPVIINSKPVGTLVIGLQWDGAATLRNLQATLLLAGFGTLLLATGGGYWLAGRAMRPVQAITRTARQISETDLSQRLNLKRQDELGELSDTFDRMLSRLEAAFERQRQFTADASHELRTPLTIVNLEVNRALARAHTTEEYQQIFSVIQNENEYMSLLVNDLLILARADSGQVNLNFENLDLSDLALETVERLASLAREKNISLATGDLPELEIKGDRFYLTTMVTNLVENAIKYTAGVGDRVRVETGVKLREGRNWALVRVSDNGPGIPPEHLPHLFERFYQVDTARTPGSTPSKVEHRGSGLGLAISWWVAQAHTGTIEVSSTVGKGTTFEVLLPLLEANESPSLLR